MARHNREGRGEDQKGREYVISYQPDWFHQVKVTRNLETGRQSTKTLFRNPETAIAEPGDKVRTRVLSEVLGVDFEVALDDPKGVIRRVTIETVAPEGEEQGESVSFVISRRRRRNS